MYRRLIAGGSFAVIGSWLIAAARMNIVKQHLALVSFETAGFVLDLIALTFALFGLLTVLSVIPEFRRRLLRIDSLGERNW